MRHSQITRYSYLPHVEEVEQRLTPAFLAPVSHAVGTTPTNVTVADVNGDGRRDVLVLLGESQFGTGEDKVAVLLGDGAGNLAPPAKYETGPEPDGLRVGDLDLDGIPDLVVSPADNLEDNLINVLIGRGDGSFKPKTDYAMVGGEGPWGLAIGNLNGDGNPDIAVAAWGSCDAVSVFYGNGDGTFATRAPFAVIGCPIGVEIADLDGDGIGDLTVDSYFTTKFQVMLSSGGTSSYDVSSSAMGHALGDFNRDGRLDVVVGHAGTTYVSVLIGNDGGTFQPEQKFATPQGGARFPVTGDFNRDRKLDIATPGVFVLLGNANGTFQAFSQHAAGSQSDMIAAADLNSDRYPDIASTNPSTGSVNVLLNDKVWAPPIPPVAPRSNVHPATSTLRPYALASQHAAPMIRPSIETKNAAPQHAIHPGIDRIRLLWETPGKVTQTDPLTPVPLSDFFFEM